MYYTKLGICVFSLKMFHSSGKMLEPQIVCGGEIKGFIRYFGMVTTTKQPGEHRASLVGTLSKADFCKNLRYLDKLKII